MSTHADRAPEISERYRAQLVAGAAMHAIPETLPAADQRGALNAAIVELDKRRQALVDDKVVRESLADLPIAISYPEREGAA